MLLEDCVAKVSDLFLLDFNGWQIGVGRQSFEHLSRLEAHSAGLADLGLWGPLGYRFILWVVHDIVSELMFWWSIGQCGGRRLCIGIA